MRSIACGQMIATHYIIVNAKPKGAKVFLVDEGIGTYMINNYSPLIPGPSMKQRFIYHTTRFINGFRHT